LNLLGAALATLCLAAMAVAAVVVWMPGGTTALVRQLLPRYLHAESCTVAASSGTLWNGVTLHGVSLRHPAAMPEGVFFIDRVESDGLPQLLKRRTLSLTAYGVRAQLPNLRNALTVGRLQYAPGRLIASDVELQDPPRLPAGSWLRLQQLEVEQPLLRSRRMTRLYNGRLWLPYSGIILLNAFPGSGHTVMRLTAPALDVRELLSLFPSPEGLGAITGRLRDVSLQIDGTWPQLTLNGLFHVERLTRLGISLTDASGSLGVEVVAQQKALTVEGQVALQRGLIRAPQTSIRLEPSTIHLEGDPREPIYDLRAVAKVEGTTIRITLTGTRQAPQLTLRSVPEMSQERLLVMLATGKSWQGADRLSQGHVSPDLVKDVVDTLLLGGRGSAWAHRVGISDVELLYDEQTRQMGIRTMFFNKFGAKYEVEPAAKSAAKEAVGLETGATHTIGAEYKLSDESSIQVEGEKEHLPVRSAAPSGGPLTPETGPIDKLLLKYKRQF